MILKMDEMYVYKSLIQNLQMIWSCPLDGNEFDLQLMVKFVGIRIFFMTPLVVGLYGHLYQSLKKGHIFETVTSLYCINFMFMYYASNLMFLLKGDSWLQLMKSLSEMRREGLKKYEKTVKFIELLTAFIVYFTSVSITALVLESYFRDSFCNNKEFMEDPNYICGCLVPMYIPSKKQHHFVKPITALYIYVFAVSQIPIMASTLSLYFGSVEFIIMKIEKLLESLEEIEFKEGNEKEDRKKLLSVVEYYIGISNLLKEMNDSVGYIFAPSQNGYNNVMIGIVGYLILKLGSVPHFMQFAIWIFAQWISCHSGQRLENASLLLRRKVYDLSWYKIDPPLRSTFRGFQHHVDVTLQMKIHPITKMNMNNFSSILKGAFSFLMFLLKM